MVLTSVACLSCVVAFAAKERLCICSKGWIPPENTVPALAEAAQPEGNHPSAPAQMLALGLALFRRMDLSHPSTMCLVSSVLETPTDSIFFSWVSCFPFSEHPASLILAEMSSGACSEANEFFILNLQQYSSMFFLRAYTYLTWIIL